MYIRNRCVTDLKKIRIGRCAYFFRHQIGFFSITSLSFSCRCVGNNIMLLTKAFRKMFIIPDFQGFTQKIQVIYDSAKQQDGGQVSHRCTMVFTTVTMASIPSMSVDERASNNIMGNQCRINEDKIDFFFKTSIHNSPSHSIYRQTAAHIYGQNRPLKYTHTHSTCGRERKKDVTYLMLCSLNA